MSRLLHAAQQALEALREFGYHGSSPRWERTANALKAALAQPEQRKPLTDEEIRRIKPVSPDFVDFRSGVRCAEAAHGIKEGA